MEDTIRDMMMVRAATAETDQNEDTNDDTDAEQSVDVRSIFYSFSLILSLCFPQ